MSPQPVTDGHTETSRDALVQLLPGPVKELASGKLLVAARDLRDPNFSETVVLLADFSSQGAMGVIVNRSTKVAVERLFPELKRAQGRSPLLYLGGPVAPKGVLGLMRSDAPEEMKDNRHVLDDVYLVTAREPLESLIAAGVGPELFRVYLGYAGWGPGQLEYETAQGSWHVVDGEADVVFDSDPGSVWERQIRRTEERMVRREQERDRLMKTKDEPEVTSGRPSLPGHAGTAALQDDDVAALAERVRAAVVRAGLAAFEDAGMQGLCCEGAWELAVSAMRAVDLRVALTPPEPSKA